MSHTFLYSLMVGSVYSNYTPHVNTHGPNPRVPPVCVDRLQLSARPAATIIFTHFALPLSSPQSVYLFSFHSSTPLSHSLFFPILSFFPCFHFFSPSFALWTTPLLSSVLSRPLLSKSLHSALLRDVKCSETTAVPVRHV